MKWREEHALPVRCDNDKCVFHLAPLLWNEKDLRPILDHKTGSRRDNRPENLQLLCPNCDSQLPTRGGANKGRVRDEHAQGYKTVERAGRATYIYFGKGGLSFGGSAPGRVRARKPSR